VNTVSKKVLVLLVRKDLKNYLAQISLKAGHFAAIS